MSKMLKPTLLCWVLFSMLSSSPAAQSSCSKYGFPSKKMFSECNDLPYLSSFLHWTHNPSSGTLQIAYRHAGITSPRWVGWAINPASKGMVGSQALVAFHKSDGTMSVYTSPVDSYQTKLQEGELSFQVSDLSATYSNNEIVIFATLKFPTNMTTTMLNQVWQDGPLSNDSPGMHDVSGPNVRSMATLNLLSGQSSTESGAANSKFEKKNIHGVLNVISWGMMMPLGALIARYVKVFEAADPAWFYLHVTCQTSAYAVGVVGWATGLQLGNDSPNVQYSTHRIIGILVFCLATLQVFALLLRPKKDHKYRPYWNLYHHSVGYSVIILGIINIFRGFHILNPEEKWERIYVGILVVMAVIAVFFEVYTWIVVARRKKKSSAVAADQKLPHGLNGTNGIDTTDYSKTRGV